MIAFIRDSLILFLLRLLLGGDKTAGGSVGFAAAVGGVCRCDDCCKKGCRMPATSYQLFVEMGRGVHGDIIAQMFTSGQLANVTLRMCREFWQ